MGSPAIHPIAYAMGPMRARRSVCESGYAIEFGKGGTRPDFVWATSAVDPLTQSRQTNCPTVSILSGGNGTPAIAYAIPTTHGWGNLRAKGSALSIFEISSKSNGVWRAVGHFRCSEPTCFKFNAPDSQQEGPIERVGWWQLIRPVRTGQGTEQPWVGPSENEDRPKPPPPSCYSRWRDIAYIGGCLLDDCYDACDDGDYAQNSVKFQSSAQFPCPFARVLALLKRAPGECETEKSSIFY